MDPVLAAVLVAAEQAKMKAGIAVELAAAQESPDLKKSVATARPERAAPRQMPTAPAAGLAAGFE